MRAAKLKTATETTATLQKSVKEQKPKSLLPSQMLLKIGAIVLLLTGVSIVIHLYCVSAPQVQTGSLVYGDARAPHATVVSFRLPCRLPVAGDAVVMPPAGIAAILA